MEENSEDTFSTITTLTETPSQRSFESINFDETTIEHENDITLSQSPALETKTSDHNEELFSEKLDSLMLILQRQKDSDGSIRKVIHDTCQDLKLMFVQESASKQHHDVDKLKKLASRYSALLLSVDQKSRSMAILANANNELNQYISNMEDYHSKQLGSLQAKLSLTRIVKEVQDQSLTAMDGAASPVKNGDQKKVKKRRSSLLFWKRSSKSTSSLNNEAAENFEETAAKLRDELCKKSVLIEQLRKQCTDYEQKERILESAIHNKNIELSIRSNRMQELNSDIKAYQLEQNTCCQMLKQVESMVINSKTEFETIQKSMVQQRAIIKSNAIKVKKFDWTIKRLNEENKLLLTKLNTKSYELTRKKIQNEEVMSDVKKFLLSLIDMTYHDRDANLDQDVSTGFADKDNDRSILTSLMRILKENITKVCESVTTMPPESVISCKDSSCQTEIVPVDKSKLDSIIEDLKLEQKRKLPHIKHDMVCSSFESDISSSKDERDSGVSLNDGAFLALEQQMRRQCIEYEKQRKLPPFKYTKDPEYRNTFKENKELSKDFLGYVEYIKDREIAGYKEDLKGLEKENYMLKSSLDDSNNKLKRLKQELSFRKSTHKDTNPLTSTPEHISSFPPRTKSVVSEMSNKIKKTLTSLEHSIPSYNYQLKPSHLEKASKNRDKERKPDLNLESVSTEGDHESFMKSFEHSNALIRGIFKEKDELQRQLDLSRQQVRIKRGDESSRMLA